jgi:hypothetical protein
MLADLEVAQGHLYILVTFHYESSSFLSHCPDTVKTGMISVRTIPTDCKIRTYSQVLMLTYDI